jgi:hypothetical protein
MTGFDAEPFTITNPDRLRGDVESLYRLEPQFDQAALERLGRAIAGVNATEVMNRAELRSLALRVSALGWHVVSQFRARGVRRVSLHRVAPSFARDAAMLVELVAWDETEYAFQVWSYEHRFSLSHLIVVKLDVSGVITGATITEIDPQVVAWMPTRPVEVLDLDASALLRVLAEEGYGTIERLVELSVPSAYEIFTPVLNPVVLESMVTQLRSQLRRRGLDLADYTFDNATALLMQCSRVDSGGETDDAVVRTWTLNANGMVMATGRYPVAPDDERGQPRVEIRNPRIDCGGVFHGEQALALAMLGETNGA